MTPEEFTDKLEEIVAQLPPDSIKQETQCLKQLVAMGGTSLELVDAIASNETVDPDVRAFACWILGKIGNNDSISTLTKLLGDENQTVRSSAVQSLGNFCGDSVVEALSKSLGDPNAEIRMLSAQALGWMDDETSVDNLIEKLHDRCDNSSVRGAAAEALGNTGNKRAVEPLIRALLDPLVEIRFWAAYALGEMRDVRAIPELQKLLADKQSIPGYNSVGEEAQSAIEAILTNFDNSRG